MTTRIPYRINIPVHWFGAKATAWDLGDEVEIRVSRKELRKRGFLETLKFPVVSKQVWDGLVEEMNARSKL